MRTHLVLVFAWSSERRRLTGIVRDDINDEEGERLTKKNCYAAVAQHADITILLFLLSRMLRCCFCYASLTDI